MGGGASSQAAFEQMIAATMILGEAMVQGLDPRYVRFPDMYRLYDFHVGPKKQQQQPPRNFQGGQMVLFVRKPDKDDHDDADGEDDDDDDAIPQLVLLSDNGDGTVAKPLPKKKDPETDTSPAESTEDLLVVYIAGDKLVLDKATLNTPNNDGWTPLHACCHTLNAQEAGITILSELIHQNANLNQVTKRGPGAFSCGWTPLHIAVAYGLEALALKLIRAGAEVNTKNSVGWTPLYDACHRNYASVVKELLRAGASHDAICPEFAMCPYPGQRALAESCRQGGADTVKVLLDWGVDKNAVNALGWTALHEAAYHNRIAIVKQLIVYGVDVMFKTNKGSVARDLTIWSEIRTILDDLMKDQAPSSASSPKRGASGGASDAPLEQDDDGAKRASPKKSPSKTATTSAPIAPLSRKEDYALLGDLPRLDGRAAPTISIKDVEDARAEKEEDDEDDQEEEEEAKDHGSSSPSKAKHKKKKSHRKSTKLTDIPPEFKCAVTRKLLKDPLRSPYGQVFERQVIDVWFRDFGNRCPLTGQPLAMAQLTADDKLKAEIKYWKTHKVKADMSGKVPTDQQEATTTRAAEPLDEREAKAMATTAVVTAAGTPEDDPYDF